MADIKKIKVGNTTYDIKDATAARSSHTHSFDTITNRGEAFLSWGGQNFSGTYGPIDAAMVPELGANRLAFMPAEAVTIEYSRDGGATWTDYGPTDPQKADLFNGRGASFTIGKATSGAGNIATNKYQLRVNIYTGTGRVYTVLNKFVIYLSTSGTNNNWCTIRARKQSDYTAGKDTWTTFADKVSVSGWSGYNVINTSGITTYGNTASTQYGHIQFIFGCDTGSTNNSYPGLQINKIFGFGGVGWTTPSTMAKTGQIYTYDSSQNVIFPERVYAKSFTEDGTSLADKYIAKSLTSAKGDMIYASAANTPARLAIGSNGQFLSIANGIPKWVNSPNTDTHYTNYLQIKGNGTEAVKFTQNADKTLNLKPGTNVSISAASGEITISATDTNTHNSHAIISGTKSDNSTKIKGSASSGDITLGDSGVTAGTYRSVTVNSKGIVVAGSSTDADTNTWRKVQLNGTDKLGTGINTNPLNIKAGSNMTITESNGTFTFAATDTNTDTKVTSVDNHYQPTANAGAELTATLSGTAGAYAKDKEYTVLTGVKAQRDAKGHVTGLTYTAQKIKDTNTTYTFNGAVSTIKDSNLTASRALISNSSGKIAVSDVTSAELSYLDGVTSSIQTQLNAKLDKTTYEWNKEFAAGSNGAISLGRYNIYDSQLTFDITSTTNQSISGKLVIATQNGTIHQAKVFGDATGELISKLIIYQSAISNSRSWVEVFCNFNGWSKNKVHVYAVALNSATVQKQMTSVTISNGVPAAANVTSGDTKWTGAIINGNPWKANSASNDGYVTKSSGQKNKVWKTDANGVPGWRDDANTNTWRGIQDNLTSDSTTDSLSAKQGKELKKLVDGKSDSGHTHNYAGSSSAGGPANSVKNALTFGSKTYDGSSAQTLTKNDVGLGNVDNTADSQKNVKYADSAGKIVSEDKNSSFSYNNLVWLGNHAKVYYVDTSKTSTSPVYYNPQLASNKETISIAMSPYPKITDGVARYDGIYDDNVGVVNVMQLKMGDIIITNNYPPRYISKKVQSSMEWNVEFTILKNPSDDMLKITGSSGFGDTNWHYRKIGHFIFNSSDTRNGAPVHISGVIGDWAQGKMIFDIFVVTRGGLKVNGFVRGVNPSCRLVIDNTENPNIFLAVKGFATYNITVNTFESAQNENNAVRGSFHIDWTGGDDFSGSDVGVTATNFGYQDLLSIVASQRAHYSYTGTFAETSGTATKLCNVSGEDTGKIICVHGIATSTNSELSIQRRNSNYYDYDCIAIAPTGYSTGTYISCTGVVPPRKQYSINTDSSVESTYYIYGKNVSNVYVITFDLP